MPVLDDYEATREIRKRDRNIIVCGLSANAMQQDIDRGRASGMDTYLTKPLEWDALEKTLKHYLTKDNQTPNSKSAQAG